MTSVSPENIDLAAKRLIEAAETGVPTEPVRALIGSDDVEAAYAVQQKVTEHKLAQGLSIVGRKIGLTSEAVQKQLGVDQPDFGILFDDHVYADGDVIDSTRILQPKVEAEVAFVLKADLAEGDLDYDQVAAAIDYGVAALEVCGSRVADWDITFGDTVADNASAGGYVLGSERKTLAEFTPKEVAMEMTVTGQEASTGTGAACLGDPVIAVQWLARQARALGSPLQAGQVVLSGALGPMRAAEPGADVHATITGLGTVSVSFSK